VDTVDTEAKSLEETLVFLCVLRFLRGGAPNSAMCSKSR
jgi:hypothetical protein